MRIVAADGNQERSVEFRASETACVSDLCGALFGDEFRDRPLYLGDAELAAEALVAQAGIAAGSRLGLAGPPRSSAGDLALCVLSGRGAGLSLGLPPGTHVIGSGSESAIAYRGVGVRPRHAALHVSAAGRVAVGPPDRAATHGLGPAALLDLGGNLLGVARTVRRDRPLRAMPSRRGTVAFNRPPRRVARRRTEAIVYPEALKPPSSTSRLSVIALVVPLLFGITMAVLIHPRMALFALLGPVMMLGGWLEDRRRTRKHVRDAAAQDVQDGASLRAALDHAAAAAVVRRHADHPSVAELARWACGATRLWERRPHHDDFMQLNAGYGAAKWRPPMDGNAGAASAATRTVVASYTRLPRGPVPIELAAGRFIGVAGTREDVMALVRGLLLQAAVLQGPADLQIAVVTDHPEDWAWAMWLPHTVGDTAADRRLLATTPDERSRLVAMLGTTESSGDGVRRAATPTPVQPSAPQTLLVLDTSCLAEPEGAPLRVLLGGGGTEVCGIVMAPHRDDLPSMCSSLFEVAGHRARLIDGHGEAIELAVAGADHGVACTVARALARFADPERREEGAELPDTVHLVDLVAGDIDSPEAIVAHWRAAGVDPPLSAAIGVTEAGVLALDVVRDGPHGLLAGTTGSGKSELLRTLVASLALAVDPEHLTFVLIDYKGGSAFDACAELPHTVGMVTDLDDQLAARALACLEAELRYRERRLREVGAGDIAAFLEAGPSEPLPRMLIVIDEFAALAKDMPDFMDALVDIAARGRSLGVHLLLATQRPAGVIRDNVRANTNLRITLRVQDRSDSTDVLGDPRAAAISRAQPGRGFVRFGPGEVTPFQAALVTGTSRAGGGREPVVVRDLVFGMEQPAFSAPATDLSGVSDLEQIVAAVRVAADLAGCRTPRRPWPEPLPGACTLGDLDAASPPTPGAIPVGLVDEPDYQRIRTMWWDPQQGSVALYGLTGAGTTTSLATIACSLAQRYSPDQLHLYAMDFDAGALAPLAQLPHVGAIVGSAERERQVRLVRHLSTELARRKQASTRATRAFPLIVLLVDNFAGFVGAFDATSDAPIRDALYRVLMEGQGVGMVAALSGVRQNAVPLAVAATIPTKLVFRMADPLAAATFGLRRVAPDLPSGRAVHVASTRTIQIALPHFDGIAAAAAQLAEADEPAGGPSRIAELPTAVKAAPLAPALRIDGEDWWIPVGIGDTELAPVGFSLGPGDHALVAGDPRSGRSNLLAAIGAVTAQQCPEVDVTVIAPRRSPLRDGAGVATMVRDVAGVDPSIEALLRRSGPQLVLIDDIDCLEATPALRDLAAEVRPDLHVIAAGRRDLKTQYNHWARLLCRSRIGLWLKPGPGVDGDLWSTPMPRHIPPGMAAGRGYLVAAGTVELVQAMQI